MKAKILRFRKKMKIQTLLRKIKRLNNVKGCFNNQAEKGSSQAGKQYHGVLKENYKPGELLDKEGSLVQ